MDSLFKKGIYAGLGLLSVTKDKMEEWVDDMAKKGEMSKENSLYSSLKMTQRMFLRRVFRRW